jgi:Myb/SANT-like DNA-binding domain
MERGARAYHLRGRGRGRGQISQGIPSTNTNVPLHTNIDVPLHTREKNWSVGETTHLLTAVQHVQVASRRTDLKFTLTEWNLIFEEFLRIAPKNQRGIDSLKNRMKTLRSEYGNFKELISRSGWAWDHTSHQVVAPCNEAWEALFAVLSFI